MNQMADDLSEGMASDFSDYRYRVGLIRGLAEAEADLIDLDIEMVKQEEE